MSEASIDVYGRDKREVAEWILNTTGAFVLNKPLPERPRIVGAPKRSKGVMNQVIHHVTCVCAFARVKKT